MLRSPTVASFGYVWQSIGTPQCPSTVTFSIVVTDDTNLLQYGVEWDANTVLEVCCFSVFPFDFITVYWVRARDLYTAEQESV